MGNFYHTPRAFTEQEIEDYKELTYFTEKEILHLHKRFYMLSPEEVAKDRNVSLNRDIMLGMAELKTNPFKDRIVDLFSSSKDGNMTFEDFLDMASVFSINAPKSVKTEYAFRMYDFDGDDMISFDDIKELINRLTGEHRLTDEDMDQLINNLCEESDLDDDDYLSFAEFESVIAKCNDFENSFRMSF